ncbi:3'-5' exonuclease [Streptomyces sp. NPDC046925]|uniref:3'-5' exonuclease n=1 Tax=Streptomyces sp. NPDC046925 TaxID=3155375 RepID=UPI0033E22D84
MARWARGLLADPELLVFDVQTTGLASPWAVQIAALDLRGAVLFNEFLDPQATMEPQAVALHGITPELATGAAPFAELLDRLTAVFHDRRCVAYPLSFDRGVLERELHRHHGRTPPVARWIRQCHWEDAIAPYAAWKGLWSDQRKGYRPQPLGSRHEAVANCRKLLDHVRTMTEYRVSPWSQYRCSFLTS